jgi:hypothetical protein
MVKDGKTKNMSAMPFSPSLLPSPPPFSTLTTHLEARLVLPLDPDQLALDGLLLGCRRLPHLLLLHLGEELVHGRVEGGEGTQLLGHLPFLQVKEKIKGKES